MSDRGDGGGLLRNGALTADVLALHDALDGDADARVIGKDWGAVAAYGAAAFAPEGNNARHALETFWPRSRRLAVCRVPARIRKPLPPETAANITVGVSCARS